MLIIGAIHRWPSARPPWSGNDWTCISQWLSPFHGLQTTQNHKNDHRLFNMQKDSVMEAEEPSSAFVLDRLFSMQKDSAMEANDPSSAFFSDLCAMAERLYLEDQPSQEPLQSATSVKVFRTLFCKRCGCRSTDSSCASSNVSYSPSYHASCVTRSTRKCSLAQANVSRRMSRSTT